MQLFKHVYESWWTPELPQDFPQGLFVYGVKGLFEINKDLLQWDLLLNAFFLEFDEQRKSYRLPLSLI